MLAIKVVCPHCSQPLRANKQLPVGKRVKCSRCGVGFAVTADTAERVAEVPSRPAPQAPGTPVPAVPASPAAIPLPQDPSRCARNGVKSPSGSHWFAQVSAPQPSPDPRVQPRADVPQSAPITATPAKPGAASAVAPEQGPKASDAGRKFLIGGAVLGGLFFLVATTALAVLLAILAAPRAETESAGVQSPGTEPTDPELAPPVIPTGPRKPAVPPPPPWLPKEEQKKVNEAIRKGVAWLKKSQLKDGTWEHRWHYQIGYAALPGLTLLACGVPPDDPHVKKAVEYVRKSMPKLLRTYEIALAILFLDRLGDPADEGRIQTLALRLVAGQKATGGWDYGCPHLSPEQEQALLKVLLHNQPESPIELFEPGPKGKIPEWIVQPETPVLEHALGKPLPGGSPRRTPRRGKKKRGVAAKKALASLPNHLHNIPAVLPRSQAQKFPPPRSGRTDNSNTQFATLGLWAARRHGLPLDRSLAVLVQRFRTSQDPKTGGWHYRYRHGGGSGSTPPMTGAGLLGLAVGHGLVAPRANMHRPPTRNKAPRDPAVEKGLETLSKYVGLSDSHRATSMNLYFLWTVERVGVLFGIRKINGKEWYPWGAKLLVKHQQGDGYWHMKHYHGSTPQIDTSFALLFLKRANLATDLSESLQFLGVGKHAENK